jgi:hypothetical protein
MMSRIGLHILAADNRRIAVDTTLAIVLRRRARSMAILLAEAAKLADDALVMFVSTLKDHRDNDPAFLEPHASMALDDIIAILETALQSPATVPDTFEVPR